MHFSRLPTELLHAIFRLLPKPALARLCRSNRFLHEACLPVLYCHLELSFRSHIRQLMTGLQRPLLRDTIQQHTRHLTLVCRQSGSHWLVADLQHLFCMIRHVHTLTFSDFQVLSVDNIRSLAVILPAVEHLQFRYCNLESTKNPKPHRTHTPSHMPLCVFQNATKLSLSWTDFGEPAMVDLLRCLPQLETICFGANHNRIPAANDAALRALPLYCPKVRRLEVSLQQVSESTLCDTIAFYGHQLERLSVRCDGPRTLRAVATYATQVHDLVVRGNGAAMANNRPLIRRPNGTTQNEQQQRLEVSRMETDDPEEPEEHGLLSILRQCEALRHLEIVCWMIQDVPSVIWNAIESVAQRRIATATRKRDALHAQTLVSEARSSMAAAAAPAPAGRESWREAHPVFEIHPPSDRTGGVWLYYFDDSATRDHQQGLRRREIGHLEKTLALDGEELLEIRRHIQVNV